MSVHPRRVAPPATLLDTAAQVLAADPAASLGEVAAAAGIGRTTLHQRYPTRHALLVALALDALDRWDLAATTAGLDDRSADPHAVLHRLVEAMVPLGARIAFLDRERTLDTDAGVMARWTALAERLRQFVVAAQRAGAVRSDVPDVWVTGALTGLVYTAWELIGDGELAPADAPRLVLLSLLHGVGPAEGPGATARRPR